MSVDESAEGTDDSAIGQTVSHLVELLNSADDDEKRTVLDLLTSKVDPTDLSTLDEEMRQDLHQSLAELPRSIMTEAALNLVSALDPDETPPPDAEDNDTSSGTDAPSPAENAGDGDDLGELSRLMVLDEFREHVNDVGLHGTVAVHCFDQEQSGRFISQVAYSRLLEPVDVALLQSGDDICLDELMELPRVQKFIDGGVLTIYEEPHEKVDDLVGAVETAVAEGAEAVFVSLQDGVDAVAERVETFDCDTFLLSGDSAGGETVDVSIVVQEGDESGQIITVVTKRGADGSTSVRYRYGTVDGLFKPIGEGIPEDTEICADCGESVSNAPEGTDTVQCKKCAREKLSGGDTDEQKRGLLGGGVKSVEDTGDRLI